MAPIIPADVYQTLSQYEILCRETQLQQLLTYFNPAFPLRPVLVAHGLEGTAKAQSVRAVLRARAYPFVRVNCAIYLSQRQLLGKIYRGVAEIVGWDLNDGWGADKIDSFNALSAGLEKVLQGRDANEKPIVLVLEGVEAMRGATATFLPALARLGDRLQGLSTVLISSSMRPLKLEKPGILHVEFPPYTRAEAIRLVQATTSSPTRPYGAPSHVIATDLHKFYHQFITSVYDLLIGATSSTSIPTFKSVVRKLWPRFIYPYLSGLPAPIQSTTSTPLISSAPSRQPQREWTYARLLIHARPLFQSESEIVLLDRLQSHPSAHPSTLPIQSTPLLKFFSTLVLISAYLAATTPPRLDTTLFSRLSTNSNNTHRTSTSQPGTPGSQQKSRRRRKLKAAIRHKSRLTPLKPNHNSSADPFTDAPATSFHPITTTNTPTKSPSTTTTARQLREANIPDPRLSLPRPFPLDRLTSILRVIHPHGLPATKSISDRVAREIVELERLRFVVCDDYEGRDGGAGDGGGLSERKWKINVSREVVEKMGRGWGVGFGEWEIENVGGGGGGGTNGW